MKISSTVGSLLLVAGLAATATEAGSSGGQGTTYGAGRTNFDGNTQGLYIDPTKESFGQESWSMQNSIVEEQNPLPSGWSEHFDQSSGQYYYYNSLDGTTTWYRPAPANMETSLDSTLPKSFERAETEVSDLTGISEKHVYSPQERQKVEDSPFSHQQSRDDSTETVISKGQFNEENSAPGFPANREYQRGDSLSSSVQTNDDADGQRWNQLDIASEQVENRDSLQLLNGPEDNTAGAIAERNVPRNPGIAPNTSCRNNDSAENRENVGRQRNTSPNRDRAVGQRPSEQPQVGGWGLQTEKAEEVGRGTSHHSPAFIKRENNPGTIPQYSQVGRASGLPSESRQVSSLGNIRSPGDVPIHDRGNPVYQSHIQPQDRSSQASFAELEQRQQIVGGNRSPSSNGQSATQHHQSSSGNGDLRFNAPPRSHLPNPTYGSRAESPRAPLRRPQYPNSQYSQQQSSGEPPHGKYQYSQYQQPQGDPKSSQYRGYNAQKQAYNQQPSVSDAVTGVLEDGTTAMKDVLGKSWEGLVGFSSRTRDAMGQARDQVVTGASVAGQSISEKSTNWWGQAKSALGSVFEKSDDTAEPQYSMSNPSQYGRQPPQRYPDRQNNQSYQGQDPTAYGPQGGRAQMPNNHQYERQPPSNQRNFQGQQKQPQNGHINARPQPRYDPPLPQQGQASPPPHPYQNQYQYRPRRPSYTDQQGHQADRGPQQLSQEQHPDPWTHPGGEGGGQKEEEEKKKGFQEFFCSTVLQIRTFALKLDHRVSVIHSNWA
ncbi:unnamed protein product [Cylindrotheca closterium]|uniref:WW domain-containing protein n=1 Tax=Cylindrotheca closterium TaxID=2856 RepID=A0AAD2CJP0_9STRA|nr:unnamed protein product [Cylindrotheca closterium]